MGASSISILSPQTLKTPTMPTKREEKGQIVQKLLIVGHFYCTVAMQPGGDHVSWDTL